MPPKENGAPALQPQDSPDSAHLNSNDDTIESNSTVQAAIDNFREDFAAAATESLTKSGWRVASAMLTRAIEDLEACNLVDAFRHKEIARHQFNDACATFREIPGAVEVICASIRAEAAR